MNTVKNMIYEIKLHPKASDFLGSLPNKDHKRCIESLRKLESDPFMKKSGTDVKKLKGKLSNLYRLRVGDYRFEYFVKSNTVWIVKAFRRGEGY
jgi:mRNA-degrading endonuclease RelE of RelBE toxin-antitoxin system